jgi:outer membrane protein assembly factor BamB
MTVIRLTIMILLLLPAVALGQTKEEREEQEGKVSNDSPARPLQMPPASTETKEAIDDFDRFQRRGAWERALKSLYTIPEDQTRRFIDGENNFIVPIERKRRSILSALAPNGQAACRLFYDAEAKKLFDEASGATELKNLERVYSAYFITSVGDNAADRLGDLYFEQGKFDRAADCWNAVVRERPDTDLSPALLSVKAAVALSRAGRQAEFEQIRRELSDRYSDEKITIGGQTAAPAAMLERLLGDGSKTADTKTSTSSSHPVEAPLDLSGVVDPAWQLRFAASIEAGMTPPELTQWESNSLSGTVPAVTIDGTSVFVNFLGSIFAVDLKSGKLLWRSASFHNLEVTAMQQNVQMLDTSRFDIVASGEHVWPLVRDLKDQNPFAPFQLMCRRADNGELIWRTADLPEYAPYDLVGRPLLADGKLFITGKTNANPQQQQGQPQQFVLAIQPHDGKLLWKTEVGTFRQGQQFYYWRYNREPSPQPQLVYRAGSVYVDTHVGVFARLDADTGALDWGYGYRTDPVSGQNRFFFFFGDEPQQEKATVSSQPVQTGDGFLIKGMQSGRLYALDPNRMKVLWERPIAKSSRLLGASHDALFLGGPEICALDLHTRELLWATRIPNGSMDGRVLVRSDGLWQLTPRGVFEIDLKSGRVRRIFRGNDLGAAGGDVLLTDELLLAVSNRTISAYPRRVSGADLTVRPETATNKERASK